MVPKLQHICKSLSHFPEHTPWFYESIYQFIFSSAPFYKGTDSSITQTAPSNQFYFSICECFRKPGVNLSGLFVFSPFSWQQWSQESPFAHGTFDFSRCCAVQAASCDKCPCHPFKWQQSWAGGALQLDKVCIKVSLPSPSPWILFFFSTKYILECYFQKAFEIQWYLRNLTREYLLFIVGKIIFFSSASIKHGTVRNRGVGSLILKSNNVGLGCYSACFAPSEALSRFRRIISLRSKVNNVISESISLHWRDFAFGFYLREKLKFL